jgi:hypothetical protein
MAELPGVGTGLRCPSRRGCDCYARRAVSLGKLTEKTAGGYRIEDFVDDDTGGESKNASRDGFCTTTVQHHGERLEVREPAAVYRLFVAARLA